MTKKKWDHFEFRFIDVENDLNDTNYSWISNLPISSITSTGFYFLTEPQQYLAFILASLLTLVLSTLHCLLKLRNSKFTWCVALCSSGVACLDQGRRKVWQFRPLHNLTPGWNRVNWFNAELLQLNLTQFSSQEFLLVKKLEIENTKTTFIISVLKVEYWVVLVSSISNFFINKMSLANKWMSLSCSNSVLN